MIPLRAFMVDGADDPPAMTISPKPPEGADALAIEIRLTESDAKTLARYLTEATGTTKRHWWKFWSA
jgi:hypothetical protein